MTETLPAPISATGVSGVFSDLRAMIRKGNADVATATMINKAAQGDASAVSNLYPLADAGNASALSALGYAADNGAWGVKQNQTLARQFLEKASSADDIAQYNLAVMLYYGRGGATDPSRAVGLWSDLADRRANGYACVRAALAVLPSGKSTPFPDRFRGYAQCAADSNISTGMYLMGRWEWAGGRYQSAVAWFERAVNAGDNNGFAQLSNAYLQGLGVDKNRVRAATWWLIHIVRNGAPGSNLNTANLQTFGLSDPDQQQAVSWAQQWLSTHTQTSPFNYAQTVVTTVVPGGTQRGIGRRAP